MHGSFMSAAAAILVAAIGFSSDPAASQGRLERDGVVLYWGIVPAEITWTRHPEAMHGIAPKGGDRLEHLVVALFRGDGTRISEAQVRAQLTEVGVVAAPPKTLEPMTINGQASFGQYFETVMSRPYRFHVKVKLADRSDEIQYRLDASPHRFPRGATDAGPPSQRQ